jgi:hypothetical protein
VTKFRLSLIFCLFFICRLSAQIPSDTSISKNDTLKQQIRVPQKKITSKPAAHKIDSLHLKKQTNDKNKSDTLIPEIKPVSIYGEISTFKLALLQNPDFNFFGKIQSQIIVQHTARTADGLFYMILCLCFYFALIRLFFSRYFSNLLSLFFRASMRQQQMREQAQQAPFPSLLLNILFVLSTSLYACFIVRYYHIVAETQFWMLFIYCIIIICSIYIVRFCILKLCGWIFNIKRATDNYIFMIFMVNKIAGFALLPFLILLSFSDSTTAEMAITISIIMIAILFVYRFAACYATIRSEIKLSLFHYFIYLCAFEIAPLLLIYKVALTYLKKAY